MFAFMAAARLYAYLSYDDAPGALRWLEALGFDVVRRQDGANGEVLHSEVRLGDVVLMVASNDAAYVRPPLVGRSTGQGLYLLVEEVDRFHAVPSTPEGAPCSRPRTRSGAPDAPGWSTRRVSSGASAPTSPGSPGRDGGAPGRCLPPTGSFRGKEGAAMAGPSRR